MPMKSDVTTRTCGEIGNRRRQNTRMRCDVCGRFVGMNGSRRLITPDSDRSSEEYETLCPLQSRVSNNGDGCIWSDGSF